MIDPTWIIIEKENLFVGIGISVNGVYGNTIPYTSSKIVEEKINKYFDDPIIMKKPISQELNDFVNEVAEMIVQRWLGKDYQMEHEIPIDFSGYSKNQIKVLKTCGEVPYGTTISYGELARKAGFEGAARFAGTCMAKTRYPIIFPCHRITRANSLGKYGDDPEIKRILLEREGIDTTTLFKKKRRIPTPL
jgi:methylated-DNA-[protein]-cysteine S-methyltransferase